MTKTQVAGFLRFHRAAYMAYKRSGQHQQAKQARLKMLEMYILLRGLRLTTQFVQWDIVKFSQSQDDKEATLRFIVLQVRGNRLLVEQIDSRMPVPPQFVYLASDMEAV